VPKNPIKRCTVTGTLLPNSVPCWYFILFFIRLGLPTVPAFLPASKLMTFPITAEESP